MKRMYQLNNYALLFIARCPSFVHLVIVYVSCVGILIREGIPDTLPLFLNSVGC